MPSRRLNLVFLAVVLGVTAAAGATAFFLHGYQVKRHLAVILDQARQLEADGKFETRFPAWSSI